MSGASTSDPSRFSWQAQPDPWRWLLEIVELACRENTTIQVLRSTMRSQTGTRFVDWIDHLVIASTRADDAELERLGFVSNGCGAWLHRAGLFPSVIRPNEVLFDHDREGIGIKVDSVDAFLNAHRSPEHFFRESGGQLSYAVVDLHPSFSLTVVERHGEPGWNCQVISQVEATTVVKSCREFDQRERPLSHAGAGFVDAQRRFLVAADELGRNWACDLFFARERVYWQSRNRAARVQYDRQSTLGLGWANHDHHTYRSSREHFAELVRLLETMGFECRERFYAGAAAGWGAQVLEQPACGLVVFADVDLSPDEVAGDFAHQGLSPRRQLGTVGLWCKLHGEAIMRAGMHHLECQFDFDESRRQLHEVGIETMAPFTEMPYLKQAFTEGETWQVDPEYLSKLVDQESITEAQAEEFRRHGARGSHLEILERNDGYKGFNQSGISDIISKTDPRN